MKPKNSTSRHSRSVELPTDRPISSSHQSSSSTLCCWSANENTMTQRKNSPPATDASSFMKGGSSLMIHIASRASHPHFLPEVPKQDKKTSIELGVQEKSRQRKKKTIRNKMAIFDEVKRVRCCPGKWVLIHVKNKRGMTYSRNTVWEGGGKV